MKICKDGRVWGQNNKEAGSHLGIPSSPTRIRKGNASEVKQGDKNPMYGKHHSAETRKKLSESKMGSKNPAWRGGIRSLNKRIQDRIRNQIEVRLWREAVLSRDNWTCQKCGKQGGKLEAHHIKSFVEHLELRVAIDNGLTLCHKCHKLTDSFGRRKENERLET